MDEKKSLKCVEVKKKNSVILFIIFIFKEGEHYKKIWIPLVNFSK